MLERTILILEDEVLIAMDIAMELEAAGMTAIQTHTIPDALASLERYSFDAAILDLDVKGQPTSAVAYALRAKRVPFVVCSGSQFSDLAEIFAGAPAISKPFRSDDLSATLHEIMNRTD